MNNRMLLLILSHGLALARKHSFTNCSVTLHGEANLFYSAWIPPSNLTPHLSYSAVKEGDGVVRERGREGEDRVEGSPSCLVRMCHYSSKPFFCS